jgi:hypothetical protein
MEPQFRDSSKLLERITMHPDIRHGKTLHSRFALSGGHDPGTPERRDEQGGNPADYDDLEPVHPACGQPVASVGLHER